MYRCYYILFLIFLGVNTFAQTTTEPVLPVATQKVTITFDSSKEDRLGFYTGDLYAHTGVRIEGKTDWQHVIGDWGDNSVQPKLTHLGNGIYEFVISPDVISFYSVPEDEKITEILFVFRTADRNRQTSDLFVKVFEEGLVVQITNPSDNSTLNQNQPVTISASASLESSLKLYIDETLLKETSGTSISENFTFTETGNFRIVAEASTTTETKKDTVNISVIGEVIVEPKPAAYRKGINYLSDTKVALVLWAPYKNNVFVIGDFNDWKISNDFQMKKDGDFFWLEIDGLETGREYIFQYLIDGNLRIADPYTEKTSDPWNDHFISDETYPGLIDYPAGKTTEIASVLQTGQLPYNWEVEDFQLPEPEKMVIYELLVRDFTEEHSYKSVVEKLDHLQNLGVNVLELMPVNEFEGNISWGYNTSFYFAPDKYYGPKNELKKLIDECHKRGIAVVIDMVLNHSYGQSPFARMYMDANWNITAENPWYNIESPNPVYFWGYDFNHESEATKELVDSVNSFWIKEYKIDGFRFDFTKGFTNTPGEGGAFDQARIDILKRMASEIRKRKPDALIILEHLTDNSEESVLANDDMYLWGNINYSYRNAASGNIGGENSNLEWGVYSERNWSKPRLVTYAESHDEERVMVSCLNEGKSQGNYNIKTLETALERKQLNAVFFIPLPGPKMIWQFGELGYDYSINYCEDGSIDYGCRVNPKPIRWDYTEDENRMALYQTVSKLNYIKQNYEEFYSPESFSYDLKNAYKWYSLTSGSNHIFAVGNFDITNSIKGYEFPALGKYYEYFTGDSLVVDVSPKNIALKPGEFRLYSTRKLSEPDLPTSSQDIQISENKVLVYPNPAYSSLQIEASGTISSVQIFTVTGQLVYQNNEVNSTRDEINVSGFDKGFYLVRVLNGNQQITKKIMIE
jgi:1,4-alpha-glucan branching enzyme